MLRFQSSACVGTTLASHTTSVVFSELPYQFVSLDRHALLTRCFSAVAEFLVQTRRRTPERTFRC